MHMKVAMLLLLCIGLLINCARQSLRLSLQHTNANVKVLSGPVHQFHSPEEFHEILGQGRVQLVRKQHEGEVSTDFASQADSMFMPSPFLNSRSKGTLKQLYLDDPSPALKKLWEKGEKYGKEGMAERARHVFYKAIRNTPKYFKNYTVFGRLLLDMGEYTEAIGALQRGISLNDLDGEAHMLLGDAYLRQRDYNKAAMSYLYAYMLNKVDKRVQHKLYFALNLANLKLDTLGYVFPFVLEQTEPGHVTAIFARGMQQQWQPFAECISCWKYDTDYRESMLRGHLDTLNLTMYKECLMSQSFKWKQMLELNPSSLSDEAFRIYSAIKDKYINAIVYWEFGWASDPYSLYLISEQERKNIMDYIKNYRLSGAGFRG
ncbi:MAG: tetratricopeptide repeat protein [Fibrobacteria bacterium]|nr:tetratricopeptide repeat protein [Fibrobacteria bacterium]